jgi:hypothetical protein
MITWYPLYKKNGAVENVFSTFGYVSFSQQRYGYKESPCPLFLGSDDDCQLLPHE